MVITGVIRPPPEIRAVADRTASYVAKNGRAFESRILQSAKGKTPKFAFLQPTSPFHAYYEQQIKFYESGGEGDDKEKKEEGNDSENKKTERKEGKKETKDVEQQQQSQSQPKQKNVVRKTEKTKKASAVDPIAVALLGQRTRIANAKSKQRQDEERSQESEQKEGEDRQQQQQRRVTPLSLPPPPPLELVSIVAPANLSPTQIETMQLVAQFAALDGKGGTFLHQLTLREWNNYEFSFCQPRHANFAYFSALVDAYRRLLNVYISAASISSDEKTDDANDGNDGDNNNKIVGSKPEENVEKESDLLQKALEEAAYRAEYRREIENRKAQQQEEGEVVAIDWHDFVVVETIDFPVDEVVELSMLPPPPPPPPTTQANKSSDAKENTAAASTAAAGTGPQEDPMDESDDEDEPIRVVPTYTPRVVGPSNVQNSRAIDPITGKSVSVADMSEHMRIQLLDPKWAEERRKFQEKQKDSNLVGGDAIVNNISRFAQARGDLFGKSEQELLNKEKDSKRKLEEANRIIREQAQQQQQPPPSHMTSQFQQQQQVPLPGSAVGPGPFPGASRGPGAGRGGAMHMMGQNMEPAAKRPRMMNTNNTGTSVPPPPPPPLPASSSSSQQSAAMPPRRRQQQPLGMNLPPPRGGNPMGESMSQPGVVTAGINNSNQIGSSSTTNVTGTDGPSDAAKQPQPPTAPPTTTTKPKQILSEQDFISTILNGSKEISLQIRIPNDPSQMAWNFYGQMITLENVVVMSKVKEIKMSLSKLHLNDMPANKIQFKDPTTGLFLKDNMTLASLNIGSVPPSSITTLDMLPKIRGGRK